MKKNTLLFLLIILLNSCSTEPKKGVSEPEKVGNYTFHILQNLNKISKDEFLSKFISIEELRAMGRNTELIPDPDVRNKLTSLERSEIEEDNLETYTELKSLAAKNGLKWTEIEYLDYIYEIEAEQGLEFHVGKLSFIEGKNRCSVEIGSIYDGKAYQIVGIRDLNIVSEVEEE